MLIGREQRESLNELFQSLNITNKQGKDRDAKIEQILAYLEIVHSHIRKYSYKRKLVILESCAGNCYVSLLVKYYYSNFDKRNIEIHCIDSNAALMSKAANVAKEMGFSDMYFHTSDVLQFKPSVANIDMVLSLHACDAATDGTLYLGLRHKAKLILSVSCCQHSVKKKLRNPRYRGITRHGIFKDRLVYMVGDSLRALLLEMNGYQTDIIEFVSSRYTDKNIMLRARYSKNPYRSELFDEYRKISEEFRVTPKLEEFLAKGTIVNG